MLAELSDLLSEEMDPETSAALVARFEQRLAPEPYCEVEKKSAGVFGTAVHGLVENYLLDRLGDSPREDVSMDEAVAAGFGPQLNAGAGQVASGW